MYKELCKNIDSRLLCKPEILLLQKNISQLQCNELQEDKKRVGKAAQHIISEIIEELNKKKNAISLYIVNCIGEDLLNENIPKIVSDYYTGTIAQLLLLLEYAATLPISTNCFVIDALHKALVRSSKLDSKHALYLWAFAKRLKQHKHWSRVAESTKNLCSDTIDNISTKADKLFARYQVYYKDQSRKINDVHKKIPYLSSIMREFVTFYYKGDASKAKDLLEAVKLIDNYKSGLILSQLHVEMTKRNGLQSFEAFDLFYQVRKEMSRKDFISVCCHCRAPFEQLKGKAPAWMQHTLFSDGTLTLTSRFHTEKVVTVTPYGAR